VDGSRVERVLGAAAAAGFGSLARARHDRALHPEGVVWAATTTFARSVTGVPAPSGGGEIDSVLRLSRAIGLPTALPDILGFALRLHDLHGPGRHQDLLLASSPAPPMHTMLAPARSFERAWFTSLLPYRIGDRRSILVAHAPGAGRFALGTVDPLHRRIEPLAEVTVTRRLEPAPEEAWCFDPIVNAGPAFCQDAGVLDAVRAKAYRASRAGRPGSESPSRLRLRRALALRWRRGGFV
jgi:hypothetical protein